MDLEKQNGPKISFLDLIFAEKSATTHSPRIIPKTRIVSLSGLQFSLKRNEHSIYCYFHHCLALFNA